MTPRHTMNDAPAISLFQNSKRTRIQNSPITAVHGDLNHYHINGDIHNHAELGLNALSSAISAGALHDAIERSPPPKCHPDTRLELLETIKSWMDDPNPSSNVLWLYGPTGVGKTAIAQSVAEWADAAKRMAGSFFFLRGKPEREEARFLFPTLAYQFALNIPGLRGAIDSIMASDHTLPSKDLDTQLRMLIMQSFQNLSPLHLRSYLVLIDGLDECRKHEDQRTIIQSIDKLAGMHNISLRFLIASRPEAHIREAFNENVQPTRRVVLDGSFEPDRDIRIFLQDGLAKIAAKPTNHALMARVPQPWPSQSVLNELIAKSSGQFIYAATVLKFIDTELYIPTEQLEIVRLSSSTHSTLFKSLDDLYTQILKACPYRDLLVRILSFMLVFHCPQPPEVYDDLLGVSRGYVSHVLRSMHSLVKFPDDFEDEKERIRFNQHQEYDQTCGLRLHHTSFGDFLLDASRSKEFSVDLIEAHAQLTNAGFRLLVDCIENPWCQNNRLYLPCPQTWGYLKNHLTVHLSKCPPTERQHIMQYLENFNVNFLAAKPTDDVSWDLSFDGLHALVTTLMKTFTRDDDFLTESFLHAEHSHWTQDVTFESILPFDRDSVSDKALLELALKYCKLLDDFYHFFLSKSSDMCGLLMHFPGLSVWKDPIPVDCLEDIFGVRQNVIMTDLERNRKFFYRWNQLLWNPLSTIPSTLDVVGMNSHILSFLSDKSRSGNDYQNLENKHIYACQDLIKLISSPDWLRTEKKDEALLCLEKMLKLHLDSINVEFSRNYSDSHPMIDLVNGFGHIVYDFYSLEDAPAANVKLLWSATRRILDWIQRQKPKKTGRSHRQSRNFDDMLVCANNQIYRQILQIEPCGRNQETITLCEPFAIAASPRRSMTGSGSGSTTPDLAAGDSGVSETDDGPGLQQRQHMGASPKRRISGTLLALHGVRFSLLAFLTSASDAGPLYIPAQEYHTQFAEICLDHCDPLVSDNIIGDWRTLASYTEWRFHLVRARPSAKLMERLCTLPAGQWLAEGMPAADKEAKVRSIKAIIEWLEIWPDVPADIVRQWRETLRGFERVRTLPRRPTRRLLG